MATEAVLREYMYAPGPAMPDAKLHDMESVVCSIFSNVAHVPAEYKAAELARDLRHVWLRILP